jgi:hypothetical protein
MKECPHEWVDNLPVRNNSQDGSAGQHCIHCYKERGYSKSEGL